MSKPGLAFLIPLWIAALACRSSGDASPIDAASNLDALYAAYVVLRGDLHVHSSTGSFDSRDCGPGCATLTANEQLAAAREAGLDFAALTEHDRNPNEPASRITGPQWQAALEAVSQANSPAFAALAGYEWTSSHRGCFETKSERPDFAHNIVILPPGATARCDSDVCTTPDQLGEFVHRTGGVILTPHPWRVVLLDAQQAGYPAFVRRSYFDYRGDGPGDVFVGAEVGPDFEPLRWKALCAHPDDEVPSQTVTLAEWQEALLQGKHLAAVSSSDRHFGFTPFGSRTTVLFATAKTPGAILEALKARRTMAASLEPFQVRLAIGDAIVGETARRISTGLLHVSATAQEVAAIEVWSGDQLLETFPPDAVNRDLTISLVGRAKGPVWAKVTGLTTDADTGTPRTTITSPIWLEFGS